MSRRVIVSTSWDDGHPCDLRLAELLNRYQIPATFYVPIANSEGKPTLGGREIRLLSGAGFEVGAHTLSHTPLAGMNNSRVRTEVFGSKNALEDILGGPVTMFCYPRGRFDRHTLQCVEEAGYAGARTTQVLATTEHFRRFEMPITIQAFPTRPMGYIRNLGRRLALSALYSYCTELRKQENWLVLAKHLFDAVLKEGGVWHLYGHSWELNELQLWDDLAKLLAYIAGREGVAYRTNSDLLYAVTTKGRLQ